MRGERTSVDAAPSFHALAAGVGLAGRRTGQLRACWAVRAFVPAVATTVELNVIIPHTAPTTGTVHLPTLGFEC